MIDNTITMTNNNNGNKDPVKIMYLDVTFQGNKEGGRLALRSRSMTYYASNRERQSNIAWNAIAKIQTGATRKRENNTIEQYLLKILNHSNQSLTFGMKNESDLDRIRNDIQDCIQNYRQLQVNPVTTVSSVTSMMSGGGVGGDIKPTPFSSNTSGDENSLTCFPQFVDENEELVSTRSSNHGGSGVSAFSSSSLPGVVVGNSHVSISSRNSNDCDTIFCDEEQQSLVHGDRSGITRGGPTGSYSTGNNNMKGEILLEEEASTIASSAAGSLALGYHNSHHRVPAGTACAIPSRNGNMREIDPEAAAATANSHYYSDSKTTSTTRVNPTNNDNSFFNTTDHDVFHDEDDYVMPVASFRLVPEGNEAYYHPTTTTKEDPWMMTSSSCMPPYYHKDNNKHKNSVCRSKWFWITLLLIVLLLVGIAIGMPLGVLNANKKGVNNTVVGLQDSSTASTTINSTQPIIDDDDEQQDDGNIDESYNGTTPSQAPTISNEEEDEDDVAAASERTPSPTSTSSPTTAPPVVPTPAPSASLECGRVGHNQPMNQRPTAFYAGSFGGSSYCRASILSLCEWTKWIPFNTYQGVGSAWFKATAIEDSFCVADIEHQIQLHVPEGVDYDLHVYHQPSMMTSANSMIPYDSSTINGSNGNTEAVVISGNDGHMSDQSFNYFIQIEYKAGSSCEPWTLTLYGHQCL